MSILYQALSRAARENARRTGAPVASADGGGQTRPLARMRGLGSLSFRPGRSRGSGSLARHAPRIAVYALLGAAVIGTGLWLYASTLPQGSGGLAAVFGLGGPDYAIVPDTSVVEEVAVEQPPQDDGVAEDVALAATDDEASMLTPPAQLEAEPLASGGIEIAAEDGATTADGTAVDSDTAAAAELAASEVVAAEAAVPMEAVDQPTVLLPDDAAPAAPAADAPNDAPPEQARETLEQTLQRLANERGFDDLAPPVEIARGDEAAVAAAEIAAAQDAGGEFSVTVTTSGGQQASFEAAYASLLAGNTDAALNSYLDVLRDEPDNSFALFGLASTLQRIGWLAEARATYEELLAIEPDNRGALANMMTLISQEAPEQALANLQRLYEINPGFSPIPAQMAVLFAERGEYDEAIRFLELAIDLTPDNTMYVYNLAIIHDRLGDHDAALGLYEQVLASAEVRDVGVPLEAVQQRVAYLKKL